MRTTAVISWVALAATALAQDGPAYRKVHARLYKKVAPAIVGVRDGARRGSGTIIHPGGWILTSSTAVRSGSHRVQIYLKGHKRVYGDVVERRPELEMALVKIHSTGVPAYLPLGNSEQARVGRIAYVLGDSFGSIFTDDQVAMSMGVVSARFILRETHGPSTYRGPVLETSAAVNPNQNGGALVDRHGELIGLVTLNYDASKFTGLAVPIDRLRWVVAKRIQKEIGVPWFGWKVSFGKSGTGVVEEISPNSPAREAGIEPGCRILAIGGRKMKDPASYRRILDGLLPDTMVRVRILKGRDTLTIHVHVGSREMY